MMNFLILKNILKRITCSCNKKDYENICFTDIPKIKNIIEILNELDKYFIAYIENSFLIVCKKEEYHNNFKDINKLIITPIDDEIENYETEFSVESTVYTIKKKERQSYLFDESEKSSYENSEINCFEGNIESSITPAILLYYLKMKNLNMSTMAVFYLKNKSSRRIENELMMYFKGRNKNISDIKTIVNLNTFFNKNKSFDSSNESVKIELNNNYENYILSENSEYINSIKVITNKKNDCVNMFLNISNFSCIIDLRLFSFYQNPVLNNVYFWSKEPLLVSTKDIDVYYSVLTNFIKNERNE